MQSEMEIALIKLDILVKEISLLRNKIKDNDSKLEKYEDLGILQEKLEQEIKYWRAFYG